MEATLQYTTVSCYIAS